VLHLRDGYEYSELFKRHAAPLSDESRVDEHRSNPQLAIFVARRHALMHVA
jgi:hypothetical protein